MIPVAGLEAGVKRYTEAFGLELRRRVMDAEYGGSIGTNIAVLTGTIEVWLLDRGITSAEYPALFFETEDIDAVRERIERAGFRVAPWKGQEINDDPLGRDYVFEDADLPKVPRTYRRFLGWAIRHARAFGGPLRGAPKPPGPSDQFSADWIQPG